MSSQSLRSAGAGARHGREKGYCRPVWIISTFQCQPCPKVRQQRTRDGAELNLRLINNELVHEEVEAPPALEELAEHAVIELGIRQKRSRSWEGMLR